MADKESLESRWMSFEDFKEIERQERWRGSELIKWAEYIENGGWIYPMSVLTTEYEEIPNAETSSVPF